MIRSRGVDKAKRLLAVDGLLKTAMEKGILDIKLVDRPRSRGDDAEDDADRGRFDNRAECLIIVHAVLLGVTANDPASLMAGQRPVGVVLMLVDPLAGDEIGTKPGYKAPTLVKSIEIWRGPW
jgi:hypothetical protein